MRLPALPESTAGMASPSVLLAVLAASFPAGGVLEALLPAHTLPAQALAHGAVVGALSYAWCRADGLRRRRLAPGRSALVAGLLPIVGLPLYFFRTRPWRQALVASALAALLGTALVLLHHAAAEATRSLLA